MESPDPPAKSGARTPWYERAFEADYLERYAHRDRAEARRQVEALVRRGWLRPSDRLLDLCCGAGRHLQAFAAAGFAAVGLDLSPALLREAAARSGGPLLRGDMRRLPFRDASFDAVAQLFTAFGYFEEDRENRRVLEEVARVLRPGGRYLLDYVNARRLRRHLVPRTETALAGGGRVVERRWIDEARGRVEKETVVERPGEEPRRIVESVRLLDPDELEAWLRDAGLRPEARLGDVEGAPFEPEVSPRVVLLARR